MEDIPEEISFIKPFLQRSKEIENANGIVSYYVYYYATNLAYNYLKKNPKNKAIGQLIHNMQNILESKKTCLVFPENPSEHYEDYITELFISADNDDRKIGSTRTTAHKFRVLFYFIQAFNVLSDLPQEWNEKLAYCKWKAVDIIKSIKKGEKPCSGKPSEIILQQRSSQNPEEFIISSDSTTEFSQLDSSILYSKISPPSGLLNSSNIVSSQNDLSIFPNVNKDTILPTGVQSEKKLSLNSIDNISYLPSNYKGPVLPQNAFDNFNLPQSILNNPTLPPGFSKNSCRIVLPSSLIENYELSSNRARHSYSSCLEKKNDPCGENLQGKSGDFNIIYSFKAFPDTKRVDLQIDEKSIFGPDKKTGLSVGEEKNLENEVSGCLVQEEYSNIGTKSYDEDMEKYEIIICDEAPKIEIPDIKNFEIKNSSEEIPKSYEKKNILEEDSKKNNEKWDNLEQVPKKNQRLSSFEQTKLISNSKKIAQNFVQYLDKNNADITIAIEYMRDAIKTLEPLL